MSNIVIDLKEKSYDKKKMDAMWENTKKKRISMMEAIYEKEGFEMLFNQEPIVIASEMDKKE